MMDFRSLAQSRRSIRKFEDKDIPLSEIQEIISIATSAPSGCNSQCWRFVAVKDKAVIGQLQDAVIKKSEEILSVKKDELSEEYMSSRRKVISFFAKAPVVVAVFMTRLNYYDPIFVSVLNEQGYDHDGIMKLLAYPDLLTIGAAVQNLLLAVHEKGYGACWMNDPAIAGKEISEILGVSEENKFISLIPIGIPAYNPKEKKLKDLGEIFTVI